MRRGSFLILSALIALDATAECSQCLTSLRVDPEKGGAFPLLGAEKYLGYTEVPVYVDDDARNSPYLSQEAVQAAFEDWNGECSDQDNIPEFVLEWNGAPPTPGRGKPESKIRCY